MDRRLKRKGLSQITEFSASGDSLECTNLSDSATSQITQIKKGKTEDTKGLYQMKLFCGQDTTLESNLTMAITDMIHSSNVQKAGRILEAKYPRITVIHGAEHVISLFYSDVFKMPEFKVIKNLNRLLYRTFGSGAMHVPHAIFQKYARSHNAGKNIGLIRAADTKMGGHVINMMRTLRLRVPLINTLTSVEFIHAKIKVNVLGYLAKI